MEKIVILTSNKADEKLISLLKMLFPECVIETHDTKPMGKDKNFLALHSSGNDIVDERLGKNL